jgi:CheY-like chemotaxis protein
MGRIFEPFFTTKELDRGTGLGLATVYGIIKQHQGWITVQSRLGEGTTFQIFLPSCDAKGGTLQRVPGEQKVLGGTETILVVEDEAPLLKLIHHILESQGYKVLDSTNGRQALQVWEEHRKRIDLLLTDLILPDGMAGTELARILQEAKPGLKVLFTSGYDADRLAKEFPEGAAVNLVQKPFHARKLSEMVYDTIHAKP